jgi:hypothetical protein
VGLVFGVPGDSSGLDGFIESYVVSLSV